ncbi:MAG: VWA domain-containing protein [Deltaproteobacteria bacterium]|nr:VWA domain-containing protein [Deltaproteobacteria bacterium]
MSILRRTLTAFAVVLISGGFVTTATPETPARADRDESGAKVVAQAREKTQRPRVEMVFALDTTGSMGGLIAGAKQKIWSIVNEVAKGKPTPEIRVGLVAYRDKGDAYVTKVSQLTGDLDAVYKDLFALNADGGGDGPENVNQALHDAVEKIEWSNKETRALRVVFLVGDAPPHNDYQDVPSYQKTVTRASNKGIIVNTIRCGTWDETGTHFTQIASLGGGEFLTISQTGGMLAVATPFDADLARLSGEMDKTYVMKGSKAKREEAVAALDSAATTAGSGGGFASAERAIFRARAKAPAAPAPAAKADLVTAFDFGDDAVDGELAKTAELPEELKELSVKERKEHLKKKSEDRKRIQSEMKDLASKREKWLAENAEKSADSFDEKVGSLVKTQAAEAAAIAY